MSTRNPEQTHDKKRKRKRKNKQSAQLQPAALPATSASSSATKRKTGTLHDFEPLSLRSGDDGGEWLSKSKPVFQLDVREPGVGDLYRGQPLSDSDEVFTLSPLKSPAAPEESQSESHSESPPVESTSKGKARAVSESEEEPSSSEDEEAVVRVGLTSPVKKLRTDPPTQSPRKASARSSTSSDDDDSPLVPTSTAKSSLASARKEPKRPPPGPTLVLRYSQSPAPAPKAPAPNPSKGKQASPLKEVIHPPSASDSDSDLEISVISSTAAPPKQSTSRKAAARKSPPKKASTPKPSSPNPELENMFSDDQQPAPAKTDKGKKHTIVLSQSDEESDDHLQPSVNLKSTATSPVMSFYTARLESAASSSKTASVLKPKAPKPKPKKSKSKGSDDEMDEVDRMNDKIALRRSKKAAAAKAKKAAARAAVEPESESDIEPDSAPRKEKKKLKRPTVRELSDDDEEESDALPELDDLPKSISKKASPRKRKEQTPEENSEDEDDLEMDFDTLQESRLRSPKQKLDKLAKLKAARAQKEARQVKQATSSQRRGVVLDSDEEERMRKKEKRQRKKDRKRAQKQQKESSEEEESGSEEASEVGSEDFIVDDDEDAPDAEHLRSMLPAHLTSAAVQSEKWHHRNFVIHLVEKTLLPDSPVSNELTLSRDKCKRMVDDLIHSLVRSQAWHKRFTDALKLPGFAEHYLDETIDGCDACTMGGRKSKVALSLHGKEYSRDPPYHPIAVNKRGNPEDTDDESTKAYRNKSFNMGSECLRRATVYHHLHHFEWNMWKQISAIVEGLEESDENDEPMTRKDFERKQRFTINRVIESMDKKNFFKKEWRELESLLEEAKRQYAH